MLALQKAHAIGALSLALDIVFNNQEKGWTAIKPYTGATRILGRFGVL
jgi:hypothetical protein